MDSVKAHVKDSVLNAFKTASAKIAIIPGGLTKKLQTLDIGINLSFKSKVRNLWEKWMAEEEKFTLTKSGKIRRAAYSEVCVWVKKAWDDVSKETIKKSFIKAKIVDDNIVDNTSSEDEGENNSLLDKDILNLFYSESDDSEFEGFE